MVATADAAAAVAESVLHRMEHRFGWPSSPPGFRMVAHWRSRTAALYHCAWGRGGEQQVVLKVGDGWDASTARRHYEQMRWVGDAVGACDQVFVVRALGWAESPPSLAMEFVPGKSLGSLLGTGPDSVVLLQRAGAWVGRFHASTVVSNERGSAAAKRARRHLRFVPRRPLNHGVKPDRLAHAKVAVSLLDFGPANALVRPDGALYVLDIPDRQELRLVHYDVARFLVGLYKHWPTRRSSQTARRSGVCAFIDGYASTGPTTLSTAADRQIVRAYFRLLCAVGAYRAMTWRRGRAAARQARWAIRGVPVPRVQRVDETRNADGRPRVS